jgi:3-deoxy-manno-octulosonate cytidylyltransferase (CMP-KDO synthetase)
VGKQKQPNSIIVIPSRMGSSRFKGKPLTNILGKSLIQRVYHIAESSEADAVIVATDHTDIFNHVIGFGGNAVMTSESCKNGTERTLEAVKKLSDMDEDFDIIINVQGDEPTLAPADINKLLTCLTETETDVATLVFPIDDAEEIANPNVVKVTATLEDELGYRDALYFSRHAIPFMRDEFIANSYLKHIGVYGFTSESLADIETMESTDLEHAEKLEQLRWLQNHMVITLVEAENEAMGVDVPEDVAAVENFLKSK